MELGTNFAAKLEPFLLMSKSARGAAAAKLIQDATSAPGIFVFAELLELPNIQELANNPQYTPHFSLLQLFSYGTYRNYIQQKDSLPPLNQAQVTKLKHLSLVSLAAEHRVLPYSTLLHELEMLTIRELEDLIIDAIYLDVLRGKLDQKEQQLEVEYTMGRDLEPGKIESILNALQHWASTTSAVLETLDQKIEAISIQTNAQLAEEEEHERAIQAILKDLPDRAKENRPVSKRPAVVGTVLSNVINDSMDVDDPPLDNKNRNRKIILESPSSKTRKRNRM